jgi:trypsin
MRKLTTPLAALCASLAMAAPADAVVGGKDAPAGKFTSVAEVGLGFGLFGCTGTLIAPEWVLTAGHCGSVTGASGAVSTPAAWPPQSIDVTIGSLRSGDGEEVAVEQVIVSPEYLGIFENRHDIALLKLAEPATKTPTPIVAPGDRAAWEVGDLTTIAGWGVTEEDGDAPDVLQEARVPITSDAYAAEAYSDYDPETMLPAGFPQGGVDTCQGDSGGPLFAELGGTLRVAGATSYGNGCAREGFPGIYARVGEGPIRAWIDSVAPDGTADTAATTTSSKRAKARR